jgi:hypothetical protein
MTSHTSDWLLRRRWLLVGVGLPVLVVLWWAFRPEKLWINQKVNEPAPFDTSSGPEPVSTGSFEGKAQQTSGRATIYRKPGGAEYLHLSEFSTANGPDTHVLLAQNDNPNLGDIDCGPLKSSQGDQSYDFPAATDLNKDQTVIIYGERSHVVFGLAKLEPF